MVQKCDIAVVFRDTCKILVDHETSNVDPNVVNFEY